MAENLTPKQRKTVEALLTTGDISQAAAAAGVSRETVYRWMDKPEFVAALREAEAAALEGLSRTLVTLGDKAASVLASVLDDSEAKQSDRIRAADIVLSRLLQLRELVTLEERVKRLEELANVKDA